MLPRRERKRPPKGNEKGDNKMKKITAQELKELAQKALDAGNPYIARAIRFFVDGSDRYIFGGKAETKETLDAEYSKTATKDIQRGYEERMGGWYDKWYRYSRADEGRAYDLGVKLAASRDNCKAEMTIIECAY